MVERSSPLLELASVSRHFGGVRAVDSISFTVLPGSIHGLIGANDAGKTTTLLALSGILPPRSGRVLCDGENVTRAAAHVPVTRGLVHVPEGGQILAGMSVAGNLEMGAYQRRDHAAVRADRERVFERFPVLRQRRA